MARKLTARIKFHGRFPDSKTAVEFTTTLDSLSAGVMAAPMVQSFRRVMREDFPTNTPQLRKLTITVLLP